MKKLLAIIGICFLLVTMPVTMAVSLSEIYDIKTNIAANESSVSTVDEPPDWANGNFSGEWGLTLLGIPITPLGWIEGYYQNIGFGRLEGVFGRPNCSEEGKISGIMLYVFFLGGVENIETGNGTFVTGIGIANETHFYWRISALIGPSFYIFCEYTKFE